MEYTECALLYQEQSANPSLYERAAHSLSHHRKCAHVATATTPPVTCYPAAPPPPCVAVAATGNAAPTHSQTPPSNSGQVQPTHAGQSHRYPFELAREPSQ